MKKNQRSATRGGSHSKSCLCSATLYCISADRPGCTLSLQVPRLSVGYPQAPQGHPLQQRLGTLQRRACPDPLRLAVKPSMGKDQKATKTSTTTKKLTSSNMNNKEASPPLLWQIAQT